MVVKHDLHRGSFNPSANPQSLIND